ncbi:MAG: hypothetical protein ACOCP4_05520 [Candidatus Woesearchaeota archaeon]
MEVVPFAFEEDEEYNEVYKMRFTSDRKKSFMLEDCYTATITIDGLNDDLVINEFCNCPGFNYKKNCKHLNELRNKLKEWGVNFRRE